MTLVSPQWLWLLFLPIVLVILHMLRRHARPLPVSSEMLWRDFSRMSFSRRRPRFSFPPLSLSLLLGALILATLTLAAAGPWRVDPKPPPALAVILDCSPSMSLRPEPDGPRRFDLGRDAALTLLRTESAAPFRLLSLAGNGMDVFTAAPGEDELLERALANASPSTSGGSLGGIVAAAAAVVLARGGGRVVIVSDFAGPDATLPESPSDAVAFEAIVVGGPAANVAVTSIAASPYPGAGEKIEVAATVLNAADIPGDFTLTASLNGSPELQERLALLAGETATWRFSIEATAADLLEVRAFPGGALENDDSLQLQLSEIDPILVAPRDPLPATVTAALDALRRGLKAPPQNDDAIATYVGEMPDNLPSRWIFLAAHEVRETTRDLTVPPVVLEPAPSGVQFLDASDLVLVDAAALPPLPPPPGAIPIALAGGHVAIAVVDNPHTHGIWWGIPVEATSLAGHGRLPLVLSRMSQWFRSGRIPADRLSSPVTESNLTPRPPEGARDAATVVRPGRREATALRTVLLWCVLVLCLAEGARRWLVIREARSLAPLLAVVLLIAVSLVARSKTTTGPGTLAVLVDVSDSLQPSVRVGAAETIARTLSAVPRGTQVAVFAFDAEPHLIGLGRAGRAGPWLSTAAAFPAKGDITDLGKALTTASRLIVSSGGGSILVATDGVDIGERGLAAAEAAVRAGVDVHVLPLVSGAAAEVAVEALHVPGDIRAGEIIEVNAIVRSTVDQRVDVVLQQDGTPVASLGANLIGGAAHAFGFLLRGGDAPTSLSTVALAERDADPGNNLALARVSIHEAAQIGVLGYDALLKIEGATRLDHLPRLTSLRRFDALLVRLSEEFLPTVKEQGVSARYVREGHGLVVSCDSPESAAILRGGPLEDVLPVRLEPPRRLGDEAAVVILVDRSGSMDQNGAGPSFLELAIESANSVASLLGDADRFGLIAFDIAPHVLQPLGPRRESALEFTPMPELAAAGGTDWSSSLDLALDWLAADTAPRRHIVLVSDGRLAEDATGDPGRVWPGGVTLSTVSVGGNADQGILQQLASRYGGRHDHVARLEDLPASLRREGAQLRLPQARRGPLNAQPTKFFQAVLPSLTVQPGAGVLIITPTRDAEIALQSEDGHPLLLFGQAGRGRSAFLATDPLSLSERAPSGAGSPGLLETVLRRTARIEPTESTALTVTVRRGRAEVDLLVPPAPLATLPEGFVRTPSGRESSLEMTWAAPGRAHASFPASEAGEYVVNAGGLRRHVALAASPERTLLSNDFGWAQRLAEAGGGAVLDNVVERPPRVQPRANVIHLAPILIALAAIIFFVDSSLTLSKRN